MCKEMRWHKKEAEEEKKLDLVEAVSNLARGLP